MKGITQSGRLHATLVAQFIASEPSKSAISEFLTEQPAEVVDLFLNEIYRFNSSNHRVWQDTVPGAGTVILNLPTDTLRALVMNFDDRAEAIISNIPEGILTSEDYQKIMRCGHFELPARPSIYMRGGLHHFENEPLDNVQSVEIEAIVEITPCYRMQYKHCGQEWDDTQDCECNNECPNCGEEIEPIKVEELEPGGMTQAGPGQKPHFYSVYIRYPNEDGDNLAHCVADFRASSSALLYANKLANNFGADLIDNTMVHAA